MKSIKGNLRAEVDVGWPDVPIFQTMLFSCVLRLNNLFSIPCSEAVLASFAIRALLRNPSLWHNLPLPVTWTDSLGKALLSPRWQHRGRNDYTSFRQHSPQLEGEMPIQTWVLLNIWFQDEHWSLGRSQETAVLNEMNICKEDKVDKNWIDPIFTKILAGPTLVK